MPRWLPFFGVAFVWMTVGPAVLVGVAGAALALVSLAPSVMADPPAALRLGRPAPPPADDAVALFRAVERQRQSNEGFEGLEELHAAARAALEVRFPTGSDAAALVAFLTAEGPDRSARCQRGVFGGKHGYYCRISYGSLAATMLRLDRWRAGGWAVGVTLVGDSEAIEHIGARVPFFGKG